jgi:hypothetical protein
VTAEEIELVWSAIEAEGRTERGWHVRKISAGSVHDLQAGRRMPQGTVGLLYDLDAAAVPPGTEWPNGIGFRTDVEALSPGPAGRIRVSLELTTTQYRDVFAALCGDIAGVVMATATSRAAFTAFLRRLHAWQKFMQLHAERGLPAEKIRGLFAELHVLEVLLCPLLGDVVAVETWQGPHALHDFARNAHALEVKSGSASGDPVFQVSRLDQLDETQVRSLHVAFVPLAEDPANGSSLPELVARLRQRFGAHAGAVQRLEDLLVATGYHDSQASTYAEPRLKARELQLHRVGDGFPRLRRHEVNEGIVAARYSVRVASCADWLTDAASLETTIAGDTNGLS